MPKNSSRESAAVAAGVRLMRLQLLLRRGRRSALARQMAQAACERFLELGALHHQVEKALLQQELTGLKALRQALPDGLLDHPRTGEADQRAGLGDVEIAEHGERRGD